MPILFIRQDITRMETDAIVNAANSTLLGGGGVDGAIHQAAGPELLEYCVGLRGCRTGEAKITPGFRMKCKYIIHTVGPKWRDGKHGEEDLLRSCYRNALRLARENGCASIAFPMISTGLYSYPKDKAFSVAVSEIEALLSVCDMTVYFVLYDKESILSNFLITRRLKSYIDDNYVDQHLGHLPERVQDRPMPVESIGALDCAPPAPAAEEDLDRKPEDAKDADRAAAPVKENVFRCYGPLPQKEHRSDSEWKFHAQRPVKRSLQAAPLSLEESVSRLGESFRDMLLRKIDESGKTDAECYIGANQDRRLFNKIKNQPGYHPSKMTVLSFAVSLELSLDETDELLMKAGYAFSPADIADVIIRFYIKRRLYNIYAINESLYAYNQAQLGNVTA